MAADRMDLKSKLLLILVVVISVFIPVQFWRGVWFGGELDEDQIGLALTQTENPRNLQHALAQLEARIRSGDSSVKAWRPEIARLADHPLEEIRLQAAWVMGQDNQSAVFHEALRKLIADPKPIVQRNAALGLTRFGDDSALPVLRSMLQPTAVTTPVSGAVRYLVEPGTRVARGDDVAQIESTQPAVIAASLGGQVIAIDRAEGSQVQTGDRILSLSPDPEHVWEALRALLLIGTLEDVPLISSIRDDTRFGDSIREQATLTLEAIRERRSDFSLK